jgi:succinyl-diaminopimelate desuccinylase
VIGGHLDTVPQHSNLPHHISDDKIFGLGACDMKGGVGVSLRLAYDVVNPRFDVTYVYYDCEEVASEYNGLAKLVAQQPDSLAGDFAILMEPSNARVEAGCQGSLRAEVLVTGVRSHSARSWMGDNAIHSAADVLNRLNSYEARVVEIDGLHYREGMNAVQVAGGVAGNVIPDEVTITINYRYAPVVTPLQAFAHVESVFDGYRVTEVDNVPGAMPGLSDPAVADFVNRVGEPAHPKFGWTDVARFSALGVPAINFGPGDPSLAHTRDEFVSIADLRRCERALRDWLTT